MANSPARIHKILSEQGILSRRKAEEAIAQGRVTVNGHPCHIGQTVDPRRDIITLDGRRLEFERNRKTVVLMLHKPRGVVTTTSDEKGRKNVMDLLADYPQRVYPVGRLDMQSEGLLLLTNDGEMANRIMHPRSHMGKTYRITVRSLITEEQMVALATGVTLDGRPTLPAKVHVISADPGRSVVQLTIFEGRNRQVRRMCEEVGLEVARLRRTSIGPIKLGMLAPGQYRELAPSEIIALQGALTKAENREQQERQFSKSRRRPSADGDRKASGSGRPSPRGGWKASDGERQFSGGRQSSGGGRKPSGGGRPSSSGGSRRPQAKKPSPKNGKGSAFAD